MTLDNPTLLGIAAVISAVGGIASTIAALRKSRSEEYEHALKELKETRAEAEQLAEELHRRKMEHPDES
jgi:hypothetical protein